MEERSRGMVNFMSSMSHWCRCILSVFRQWWLPKSIVNQAPPRAQLDLTRQLCRQLTAGRTPQWWRHSQQISSSLSITGGKGQLSRHRQWQRSLPRRWSQDYDRNIHICTPSGNEGNKDLYPTCLMLVKVPIHLHHLQVERVNYAHWACFL